MINQIDLTEKEFRIMQDLIHDRFGIYLKEEKRSFIKMKLYPRLTALGFQSFSDYIQFIQCGPDSRRELSRMISLLTNTETYFFREMPQLNVFRESLLTEFKEKKSNQAEKKIKILSAGCSTGEEVYTLAMLTFDTGDFFWGWNVEIVGLDVNEKALDVARQGAYYERSFRMTDSEYQKKFFSPNSGDFLVKDSIKRMTSFISGNITSLMVMKDFDAIFCRNVLIYFSEEKVDIAINNFYNALRPGGYLLLGHSETLNSSFSGFETKRFPGTIIYKKREI
jgi:chemotaxis protein methyltransferase CheR